jgi:tRNA-2-methylthio-N6-dimethylallyladenosine synthase
MGRRYTKESYLELVNKLKTNISNISLTTDIIVGFPNESDEDFNETLDVVNTCKFDLAYTFIYSPRVGTPASKMEDNIPLEVKESRLQILNELINKYAKEANDKLLNTNVSVLLENVSNKPGYLMGYSDTNKVVNVKAPLTYIGKIVNVEVIDSKTWSLTGKINE